MLQERLLVGHRQTRTKHLLLMIASIVFFTSVCLATTEGDRIPLRNQLVMRELTFDGHVWRTTKFARGDGRDALTVNSDDFHLLFLDDTEVSLDDYEAAGEPLYVGGDIPQQLTIRYRPR